MCNIQSSEICLKPAYTKLRNQFYELNVIQSENYDDQGNLHLHVIMAPSKLEQLIKQAHLPIEELLGERASLFQKTLEEFEIKD